MVILPAPPGSTEMNLPAEMPALVHSMAHCDCDMMALTKAMCSSPFILWNSPCSLAPEKSRTSGSPHRTQLRAISSSQFLKFNTLWAALAPEGIQERTNTTVPSHKPLYTCVCVALTSFPQKWLLSCCFSCTIIVLSDILWVTIRGHQIGCACMHWQLDGCYFLNST